MQEMGEIECRKLLVDSYSSQLTTHARLIIGIAIIILTLLEVKRNLQPHPHPYITGILQSRIIYFGILMASASLWFLIMRHLVYGTLVSTVTFERPHNGDGTLLRRIADATQQKVIGKKILLRIPICWFYSIGDRKTEPRERWLGRGICVVFALVTTLFVWMLMG